MSDPVARESTRRRLTAKQAATVDRLGRAAVDVLSREGFAGLTIRMVAAEAGVGAATAYTYFSSKEHLVAEVFWRRLATTPAPANDSPDPTTRAVAVLRHIALLVADEPELAGAVTNALLGKDPDVEHLRLPNQFTMPPKLSPSPAIFLPKNDAMMVPPIFNNVFDEEALMPEKFEIKFPSPFILSPNKPFTKDSPIPNDGDSA